MEWNAREAVRKGMATGIWLGVTVGIVATALSGSSADDLGVGQPGSNGEALPEVEVSDAVATTPGELESAGPRPMIRFKNANPQVSYGGMPARAVVV